MKEAPFDSTDSDDKHFYDMRRIVKSDTAFDIGEIRRSDALRYDDAYNRSLLMLVIGDAFSAIGIEIETTDLKVRERLAGTVAARNDRKKSLIDRLLSLGTEINFKDSYGYTALHFAARNNDLFLVQLLLKNGASIKVKNDDGETPFDMLNGSSNEELVKLLKI